MANIDDPIVIAGAARTPIGAFQGQFAAVAAPDLGGAAIAAAVSRAGLKPDGVEQAFFGCVLPAGQGQAPARQAVLKAGLPESVGAVTVNKMCGSGMQAAIMAHDALTAGSADVVIAGGMESMTNAPYLLDKARGGYRMGHGTIKDHMFLDGLEDAYDKGKLMGVFAEHCAEAYQFTRQAQDAFALTSLTRARTAVEDGIFASEIVPFKLADKKGDIVLDRDETPMTAKPEKIPTLKPAFKPDGTVTAANASSISDGAAALVMTRRSVADRLHLPQLAVVRSHAFHAQAPAWFTTAPIGASRKALARAGWTAGDVDLYEINEAFAVVAMAAMKDLDIPHDKVNVNGGACALGHPIGASGARILVTLLAALKARGLKRGLASLCIGGGEATAMAIETI